MNKVAFITQIAIVTSFCALHGFHGRLARGEGNVADSGTSVSHIQTSGATSYSSYLTHYFDNLTENFGMNYAGSCGYVAMAMLLSYYDASFDRGLVPTAYDVDSVGQTSNLIDRECSPGVRHDDYASMGYPQLVGTTLSNSQYLDYVNNISGSSLHARLIQIGALLGYYNLSEITNQPASTSLSERVSVLEYYLQNDVGLSSQDYTITFGQYAPLYFFIDSQNNLIKNEIISLLQSGKPVLVGLANSNNNVGAHAAIAYDYNPTTGTIYMHYGLSTSSYSTHSPSGNPYDWFVNYMAIEFNYSPSAGPGENYVVTDTNNLYTRRRSFDSADLNYQTTHTHSFTSSYSDLNYSCHESYCSCGDYLIEQHYTEGVLHYYNHHLYGTCDYCGGTIVL